MKQASLSGGKIEVEEVPIPSPGAGQVQISVCCSCVSVGTELAALQASGESLLTKVKKKPHMIRKALKELGTGGVLSLLKKIEATSGGAVPMGYSISGIVLSTGPGITKFAVGDTVAAAGAGYANHAEVVVVPENLVVHKPEGVSFADASTVALGAIAMHGVRRCSLQMGEFCVVMGVGMLGMLALQMFRSSGVRVIAVDPSPARRAIALTLGAERSIVPEAVASVVVDLTLGKGVDAVLFAAATSESGPLQQAFSVCKRRGRVIMLGVSGMHLKREDLYPKELDLQMATSYGPGRYDSKYEEEGCDYPYAYVRWTEGRNMAEYLRHLKDGLISLGKLVSETYTIDRVSDAFADLERPEKPFTAILEYPNTKLNLTVGRAYAVTLRHEVKSSPRRRQRLAVIGLGAFARAVHLPHILSSKDRFELVAVMDHDGHRAVTTGRQFGAALATTSLEEVLGIEELDAAIVATRHDSHAAIALRLLKAGVHTLLEKPLATSDDELCEVIAHFETRRVGPGPILMLGYNRRFSPLAREMKAALACRTAPAVLHYRMNAGFLAEDHWLHTHGGRIVGEACHAIDLISFLIGNSAVDFTYRSLSPSGSLFRTDDNVAAILKYSDGSLATFEYFSTGNRDCSKESVEVHFDGKSLLLDDFKSLQSFGTNAKNIRMTLPQKGHKEELYAFSDAISRPGEAWPIPLESMFETSRITLTLAGLPKGTSKSG